MTEPNVSTAEAIAGHMAPEELRWLAEQASRHHRIAELGSWQGRSTRAMADNLPADGVLYAIDTWDGRGSILREIVESKPDGWLFGEFAENMGELLGSKVIPIPITSAEAVECLSARDLRFDMIFIDAGHEYEVVRADILAWRLLLAPGGLLCGHDYVPCDCLDGEHSPYSCFPGVVRAVDELIPDRQLVGVGSIWRAQ